MDKVLYFILIVCVVGYFMVPKVAGFDPPQLYWQYQIDKMGYYFNDFRETGGLSKFLPFKLTPQNASDLYKKAVLDQLKELDNLKIK